MKYRLILLGLIFTASSVFAGAGTGAIDLLKVPAGAKTQSMGGAYTAVSDDLEAFDVNPAGLGFINGNEVNFVHDLYLDGIFFDSLYYAYGTGDSGTYGGSFKYLSGGSITQTNETATGNYGGEGAAVSAFDFSAAFGYGINLSKLMYNDFTKNLNTGAILRFSGESIGQDYLNMAISADVGLDYTIVLEEADFMTNRGETIWNKIGLGFAARNLGTSFSAGATPMTFAVGAYTQILDLFGSTNRMRISMDVDYSTANSVNVCAGLEHLQMFGDFSFALRAGGNFSPAERLGSGIGLGGGLGFRTGQVKYALDYVFMPFSEFGSSQKIGLYIKF
jgi:hypothetical protein